MAKKKREFGSMTEMFEFFKKTGAQGGKKRAANLTPEELAAIGKKGAEARWGKKAKVQPKRKDQKPK
jgi:general stress protein YciG